MIYTNCIFFKHWTIFHDFELFFLVLFRVPCKILSEVGSRVTSVISCFNLSRVWTFSLLIVPSGKITWTWSEQNVGSGSSEVTDPCWDGQETKTSELSCLKVKKVYNSIFVISHIFTNHRNIHQKYCFILTFSFSDLDSDWPSPSLFLWILDADEPSCTSVCESFFWCGDCRDSKAESNSPISHFWFAEISKFADSWMLSPLGWPRNAPPRLYLIPAQNTNPW